MVKEKFKSSAAGFTGILSALTAAAVLSFSVAGCGLVAMGITESLGSPDLKKISNAKEIGYAVTFRTPAVASEGHHLYHADHSKVHHPGHCQKKQ